MSSKNRLLALFFGFLICLAALTLAEIYFALLDHGRLPDKAYSSRVTRLDPYGITRAQPSQTYRVEERSRKTGKLIYDVSYSVDAYSRRITPIQNPENRSLHLLFFGCSYTYGEGLRENETLPFRAGEKALSFMPYNYAYHGHGPSQMFRKLKSSTLSSEVAQKEGSLIYVFMDEHIQRTAGFMRFIANWGENHPYYDLTPEGEILDKGTFASGEPLRVILYKVLNKSHLLNHFHADFPLRVTDKHVLLTARLIEESAKLYRQQFPSGKFYLVLYPGSRDAERIKNAVKDKGVIVMDYSNLFSSEDPRYYLDSEDRHPNALAIQTLAAQITGDLNLQQ